MLNPKIDKLNAKDKILNAAKKLYMARGIEGVSSRDIAEEAGTNVALVNYYYCSKSKLAELVFLDAIGGFVQKMYSVLNSDMELEPKIRIMIEHEFNFLHQFPDFPVFLYSEIRKGGACDFEKLGFTPEMFESHIFNQIKEGQKNGTIRDINLASMMMFVLGNCHIPFLARPVIQRMSRMDDEQYENQLKLHKQYVTEMLISYLFIKK